MNLSLGWDFTSCLVWECLRVVAKEKEPAKNRKWHILGWMICPSNDIHRTVGNPVQSNGTNEHRDEKVLIAYNNVAECRLARWCHWMLFRNRWPSMHTHIACTSFTHTHSLITRRTTTHTHTTPTHTHTLTHAHTHADEICVWT